MAKMTQKEMVYKYLKEHDGITSLEAYEAFGITRLASVIFKLRQDGHPISSESLKVKNRYGVECTVANYALGNK